MNVAGLTLGISCSLIIFLIVRFEYSFDDFHSKKDRLFKIITHESHGDQINVTQGTPGPLAEAIRKFADIEKATLFVYEHTGLFTVFNGQNVRKLQEPSGVAYAEPVFFEMFDFPILQGDIHSLNRPDALVLTKSTAEKLFPDGNAIGRTVRYDNKHELIVTAIAADFPQNTDFPLTAILSVAHLRSNEKWVFEWTNLSSQVHTYVLLKNGADQTSLEKQLLGFSDPYRQGSHYKHRYEVRPIRNIHFSVDAGNNIDRTVSPDPLLALSMIGLFLIVTACINFINMATAQAVNRSREVGVRKVLGAVRARLISGFMGETFVLVAMAVILSAGIVEVFGPMIVSALQVEATLAVRDIGAIGFLVGLFVAVGLLAGLYPAMVLSGFRPVAALRSKVASGGTTMRRGLVIVQFAISQMLMIGTTVVVMQMDFMQNQDMGFVKDGVVVLPLPDNDKTKMQTLRTELMNLSGVQNVSMSYSSAISENRWDANVTYINSEHEENLVSDLKFADANYIDVYGLKLLAGRNVANRDTIGEYVVNEAFIQKMGIHNPADAVGKTIRLGRSRPFLPIVGVVKDFNATSMHEQIRPLLIATRSQGYQEIAIRLHTAGLAGTMKSVEAAWNSAFPEFVFSSEFLDQRIESLYRQEKRVAFLFQVFAGIAIAIGCIGLLGLVSFMAAQKTKEIGVRKVLGASVFDILTIFSKEMAVLIGIAFVVAAPAAYGVMQGWLDNFAYRISVGAGVFVLAITVSVLIAGATIGYRALRAATANPVDSLRYE
jgi:ABC-type antimicrobial peptide transport system permease subunit